MARAVATASRDSRTADRPGPAESSPFRSSLPRKRLLAAEAMVTKRDKEIGMLEGLLLKTSDLEEQRRFTLRLVASINNRNSWLTYIAEGSPKETRAVIVPEIKTHHTGATMSRSGITLTADNLKVRCAAKQRYAVAIPNPAKHRLQVTKRTDDIKAIAAELRRLRRAFPNYPIYLFDLPTGVLVQKVFSVDPLPDSGNVARRISDVLGRK